MQRNSLPPPHPSLPAPPLSLPPHCPARVHPSTPYIPQPLLETYSSHYAQAYLQSYPTLPAAGLAYLNGETRTPFRTECGSWYQPGNNRCTHKGCTFSGSHKSVETHMMDRHLIFPPGWEKRKKKPEWDADPTLKGKPIPIQGTTIILDSPEVLEAWIAERKKRFPTATRVGDKKRKLEEAVARGQLPFVETGFRKRQKIEDRGSIRHHTRTKQEHHPRHEGSIGRGRGRGQGPRTDSGWRGRGRGSSVTHSQMTMPVQRPPSAAQSESNSEDDDGEPEVISSKASALAPNTASQAEDPPKEDFDNNTIQRSVQTTQRPNSRPLRPKRPPRNPFASRPTLLRNLLIPEIRITISNLSQAIRFLVDNDFLHGVELKPGEAEDKMIEVVEQGTLPLLDTIE